MRQGLQERTVVKTWIKSQLRMFVVQIIAATAVLAVSNSLTSSSDKDNQCIQFFQKQSDVPCGSQLPEKTQRDVAMDIYPDVEEVCQDTPQLTKIDTVIENRSSCR